MKKVPKFFSDQHRFFLLTDNTVVHKYNIHNHIPREYGHQLGSNLNVSSVPVFHGSRTSPTSFISHQLNAGTDPRGEIATLKPTKIA